ncbi:hypothetical protein MNBD_GAMMA12-1539 [hydrothermal vent metagenome]|uniref:Uncharacterized protein n=1 Tax=hydrothermal vent metagenome TaxID=652676 RepID=A0A3B0Z1C5_9ZZZZ
MTQSESPNSFLIQGSEAHKIAQAVYYSVTGKTEKLTKAFSDNYKITFEDIQQLHSKCEQMCTQWNVIECNENITVNHVDDNKESFSSFERFKIYDKSQTSAVEGVSYEFNALILPNGTPKPQPYKINIRIASAIAVYSRSENDGPSSFIMKFFRSGPLIIEIEYVDYVIARNMMSTIESWVKEIEIEKRNKYLIFLQSNSHWIPKLTGTILMMVALVASFFAIDSVLIGREENTTLAKFLLSSFGFIVLSSRVGTWLGRITENTIDRIQELSHIELNRGDKNLLSDFKKKNSRSYLKSGIYILIITAHAVASGYFATFLYESLK